MPDGFQQRLRNVDAAMLTPFVCQALKNDALRLDHWQVAPLQQGGGQYAGGVQGIFRFSGRALDLHTGNDLPWSLILKACSGVSTGSADPASWNYWKREPLLYQSGLLDQLPGELSAPRCYAVLAHPQDEFWIWLEDVQETSGGWTMERYSLAARHLGQFNGAYLTGYPLPKAKPWLTWGRTREWCAETQPFADRSRQYSDTPVAKQLFTGGTLERTLNLWAGHRELLQAFERLPHCFCHHDAFHRNLLARQGSPQTVAIDWSISGFGRVGEEAGVTTAISLNYLGMAGSKARELDQAVFSGYVEGLREAGWQGDVRQARLGYAVNAFLLAGVTGALYYCEVLQTAEGRNVLEATMGVSVEAVLEQWAEVLPFLLDLGDEAYQIINELA